MGYNGEDIWLNEHVKMGVHDYPSLKKAQGKTLITTDGTRLSFHGLPCPNLGTGGHYFHSIYEYITLEDMVKVSEI